MKPHRALAPTLALLAGAAQAQGKATVVDDFPGPGHAAYLEPLGAITLGRPSAVTLLDQAF